MHPIVLALLLTLGGLAMCALSKFAGKPLLVTVTYWLGLLVLIVGLILLLMPILVYLYKNLTEALGIRGWAI